MTYFEDPTRVVIPAQAGIQGTDTCLRRAYPGLNGGMTRKNSLRRAGGKGEKSFALPPTDGAGSHQYGVKPRPRRMAP